MRDNCDDSWEAAAQAALNIHRRVASAVRDRDRDTSGTRTRKVSSSVLLLFVGCTKLIWYVPGMIHPKRYLVLRTGINTDAERREEGCGSGTWSGRHTHCYCNLFIYCVSLSVYNKDIERRDRKVWLPDLVGQINMNAFLQQQHS